MALVPKFLLILALLAPPGTFRILVQHADALPVQEVGSSGSRGRRSSGSANSPSLPARRRHLSGVRRPDLGASDSASKRKLRRSTVLEPLPAPADQSLPLPPSTTPTRARQLGVPAFLPSAQMLVCLQSFQL